jgi:Integrase core domain
MAGRSLDLMDVREVLRHLQTTTSLSAIQRATGLNRRTIMRYRRWATEQGLLAGPLPPLAGLPRLAAQTLAPPAPPQTVSTVEPYRDLVLELHARGVEGTAIWQRLGERGYAGSLSSIYRFLHQLVPPAPNVTVRVERAPGGEAPVDFGYAGYLLDATTGQRRKAWAFVMPLAYSRHQYVEFVHDQALPTWITLHRHAFAFFGGIPRRIVLDNLKAGIARACFDDPQIQATYRECAEHYGFLIAPCAPRTPEHKGKVEQGGVHYLKRNFLGGRAPTRLRQANAEVRAWCQTTAGLRRHGTTKEAPLERFAAVERAQLLPLPPAPYDPAVWKRVALHRDCYIVFEQAFYSAPFRLVGQRLWVRGGNQEVRLYTADYQLVATHQRAPRPGARQTHPDHLPPEKLPQLLWTRALCPAMAAEVGPAATAVVQRLLADPVVERHSRVVRILRLREAVGDPRLEAACARALRYDDLTYATIKRILDQGLETDEGGAARPMAPARTFVRTATELLGHVFGGVAWNSSIS